MQQLDPAAAVLEQRRQPAADPDVDPHLRIGRVGLIHVVAFLVRDHLERQLVVVAEEHRPLAVLGDVRRLPQDLDDRVAILLPHRHEHARHQREVKGHVALVAVAEVGTDVGRPLVRFREQHPVRVRRVELLANLLEDIVRLLEVLADRAFALDQVRHSVQPQAVDATIEPEAHHLDDRFQHRRVVEVQVRLVVKEPVPVVRLGRVVPRPVRLLGVGEDDPDALILLVGVAPDVELTFRRSGRRPPRGLEPRMLIRRVIDDQLGDHPQLPAVRLLDEAIEVGQRAIARVDVLVVGDVVAVVPQRRRVEGQEPDRVDAEALDVFQLLRQAREIADPVVRAVEERADVGLVDDGILVPEGIRRVGHARTSPPLPAPAAAVRPAAQAGCAPRGIRGRGGRSCATLARCSARPTADRGRAADATAHGPIRRGARR